MKKTNILLLVALLFALACGNNSSSRESENESETGAAATEIEGSKAADDAPTFSFEKEFPELTKILAGKTSLAGVKNYAEMIAKKANSEAGVLKIMDTRKQILEAGEFQKVLSDYYYNYDEQKVYDYWQLIDKELFKIGFQSVYAEGMLQDIALHSFLKAESDKYLKEETKLYLELKDAEANSRGGEYPYMGLGAYGKTVEKGEILLKKYPAHKNIADIEAITYASLFPYVDYHRVASSVDYKEYCVGGFVSDIYPSGTEISNHDAFLETYKNSKFHQVVKRIRENPSVIAVGKNGEFKPVYLVVTDVVTSHKAAEKKVWKYLNEGLDIPHALLLTENGKEMFVVAYRFFPDKEKAAKALAQISAKVANAKILKIVNYGTVVAD